MKSLGIESTMAWPELSLGCPGCGLQKIRAIYSFEGAPVHSVLLMPSREAAVNYPRGDVKLGFCEGCGFIWNLSYDPALQEYSKSCEETQAFSGYYNAFARSLASSLIERHGLKGKHILEIGCGKGEFLALLCEMGGNTGIGFDPAFSEGRFERRDGLTFISDFYSEKYSGLKADFIVCKMTLEHIDMTGRFIAGIRKSLGDQSATVFFQVPDVTRVIRELAFWDIYYEHCSYFSPGSLSRLFRAHGFDIVDLRRDYGGQYLLLEAKPMQGAPSPFLDIEETPAELDEAVTFFSESVVQKISLWRHKLREFSKSGYRTVVWGSGSKGVAFLSTLGITDEIRYVVDINPFRKGTFMAGTGHEIVAPDFVAEYRPDAVILMNPVYKGEVEENLKRLRVQAQVLTV